MRIVLSRKGFDSASGGRPSPIINGRAISLPIPAVPDRKAPDRRIVSQTTYESLGIAQQLQLAGAKITADHPCHDDPMFDADWCWFGQCDAAQGHLENMGVNEGDVFLFFGLFLCPETGEKHHRIFGYMQVAGWGRIEDVVKHPLWRAPPREHPHLVEHFSANNSIWFGKGMTRAPASRLLQLTDDRAGSRVSQWQIPSWFQDLSLSYHGKSWRWGKPDERGMVSLTSVSRGQEFVCNVGKHDGARQWLDTIISEIERP